MSWLSYHRQSEELASQAEVAVERGHRDQADQLYAAAAEAEEMALGALAPGKSRTFAITTVSAVALYYKAGQLNIAENRAHRFLGNEELPRFAYQQLQQLLSDITSQRIRSNVPPGHLHVSLRGGWVLHGSAPVDLVMKRFQVLQSLVYRTAEHLNRVTYRRSGRPSKAIRERYQPWLLHTAAGSYQFEIALRGARDPDVLRISDPSPEDVVAELFNILQVCVGSPRLGLSDVVGDVEYRLPFLRLAHELAPGRNEAEAIDIRGFDTGGPLTISAADSDSIKVAISGGSLEEGRSGEVVLPGRIGAQNDDFAVEAGLFTARPIVIDVPQGWVQVYRTGRIVRAIVAHNVVEREIVEPFYSDPLNLGTSQLNYICRDPSQQEDVRSYVSHDTILPSGVERESAIWNPNTGEYRQLGSLS